MAALLVHAQYPQILHRLIFFGAGRNGTEAASENVRFSIVLPVNIHSVSLTSNEQRLFSRSIDFAFVGGDLFLQGGGKVVEEKSCADVVGKQNVYNHWPLRNELCYVSLLANSSGEAKFALRRLSSCFTPSSIDFLIIICK